MQHSSEMHFTVEAPVDSVYAYFADLRHVPDFDPPVRRIQPTSGAGWLGSTFALDFAPLGPWPCWEFVLSVEERDPGRVLAYRIDGKRVSARDRISFRGGERATEVVIAAELELRGVLSPGIAVYRLMLPMLRRLMARSIARVVRRACQHDVAGGP